MAVASVNLPKQWEDWASWVLGLWLCLSPWALMFDLDTVATRNAVVVGFAVILAEVVTLSAFKPWEEWINIALGAWLIASPWVLAVGATVAKANFVVIGLLVIGLALHELRALRRNPQS